MVWGRTLRWTRLKRKAILILIWVTPVCESRTHFLSTTVHHTVKCNCVIGSFWETCMSIRVISEFIVGITIETRAQNRPRQQTFKADATPPFDWYDSFFVWSWFDTSNSGLTRNLSVLEVTELTVFLYFACTRLPFPSFLSGKSWVTQTLLNSSPCCVFNFSSSGVKT